MAADTIIAPLAESDEYLPRATRDEFLSPNTKPWERRYFDPNYVGRHCRFTQAEADRLVAEYFGLDAPCVHEHAEQIGTDALGNPVTECLACGDGAGELITDPAEIEQIKARLQSTGGAYESHETEFEASR